MYKVENKTYLIFHQYSLKKIISVKITRKNAIVEYLDYQISDTQVKGPKGN